MNLSSKVLIRGKTSERVHVITSLWNVKTLLLKNDGFRNMTLQIETSCKI